ncbi:MAG: hypothetical protein LUP97_05375, partial [Methanoregula sp.]|nr:hypothetical protein [Methanoregula sp.]
PLFLEDYPTIFSQVNFIVDVVFGSASPRGNTFRTVQMHRERIQKNISVATDGTEYALLA